jgi:hypothetical protein
LTSIDSVLIFDADFSLRALRLCVRYFMRHKIATQRSQSIINFSIRLRKYRFDKNENPAITIKIVQAGLFGQ